MIKSFFYQVQYQPNLLFEGIFCTVIWFNLGFCLIYSERREPIMANAAGSAGRCDANGNLTCIQDGLAGHKSSPDCKPLIDNVLSESKCGFPTSDSHLLAEFQTTCHIVRKLQPHNLRHNEFSHQCNIFLPSISCCKKVELTGAIQPVVWLSAQPRRKIE